MKKYLFIVSVLLIAFSSCVRQGVEEPIDVVQEPTGQRLYFRLDSGASLKVDTKSGDDTYHFVDSCQFVKGYRTGSLSQPMTKGYLNDEADYFSRYNCVIYVKRNNTWSQISAVGEYIEYDSGSDVWYTHNSDYYVNNCQALRVALCSYANSAAAGTFSNTLYRFTLSSLQSYSNQYDHIFGIAEVSEFDCAYDNPIDVTLIHDCTALKFKVVDARQALTVKSISIQDAVTGGRYDFNFSIGDWFYTSDSGYDDITLSGINKSISIGSQNTDILSSYGGGSYVLLYPDFTDAYLSVTYRYNGIDYTVGEPLSYLISNPQNGVYYEIEFDFDSLVNNPYIYFGSYSQRNTNQEIPLDCNGRSNYDVPFSTNIPTDVYGDWDIDYATSAFSVVRNSGNYVRISSIPGNPYPNDRYWPDSEASDYVTLYYYGHEDTPLEYVTASNGFLIHQSATEVYGGTANNNTNYEYEGTSSSPEAIAASGETINCYLWSTYDDDSMSLSNNSNSWITYNGSTHKLAFAANNNSSSRTGSITVQGSVSGPNGVSKTYYFSQEPNITYVYGIEFRDASGNEFSGNQKTINVGDSFTAKVDLYRYKLTGGVYDPSASGAKTLLAHVTNSCSFGSDDSSCVDNPNGNTFRGLASTSGTDVYASYYYSSIGETLYTDDNDYYNTLTVVVNDVYDTESELIVSPDSESISVGDQTRLTATYSTYDVIKTWDDGYNSFVWEEVPNSRNNTNVTSSATWSFSGGDNEVVLNDGSGYFTGIDTGSQDVYASYSVLVSNISEITVSENSRTAYEPIIELGDYYNAAIGGIFQGSTLDVSVTMYWYDETMVYNSNTGNFVWVRNSTPVGSYSLYNRSYSTSYSNYFSLSYTDNIGSSVLTLNHNYSKSVRLNGYSVSRSYGYGEATISASVRYAGNNYTATAVTVRVVPQVN